MAESFANDAQPSPGLQALAVGGDAGGNPIRLSSGIGGNEANAAALSAGRPQAIDPTIGVLSKLAGELLQPKIKQARQEQFLRGMQEAQSGKALEEIIKDRPWYTELFGPSAAAEGARAYTVQQQVAGFAAGMENQMPKLAEQGPEAIRAAVQEQLNSLMTGDTAADQLIMQSAAESFGPLFKRHAKEHYVYLQNKASDSQLAAWGASSASYQQQMADPKTTPEDRQAAADRLLGQLSPFADQTEASYEKNVAALIQNAAGQGDFHTVRLFQNTKYPDDNGNEVSLWDRMPLDVRTKLNAAMPTLARQALNKQLPKYALEMALFVNDTAQDPRGIAARAEKLNRRIAEETGILEAAAIPPESIDNITGNVLRAQAAERGRTDPGAAQAAKDGLALALVNQPSAMAKALAMKQVNDEAAEKAAATAWSADLQPQARAKLLENRGGGVYDFAKADMYSMGLGGNPEQNTKGVEQVAATYAAMSDATRGAYFSTDEALFYDRYNSSVRAGVPPDQAFQAAKLAQPLARDLIPDTEKPGVQEAIRTEAERRNQNWFGWNRVSDSALRTIEAVIGKNYRVHRGLNTVETSVARAYTQALTDGLAVIGEHAIIGQPKQAPLESILATGEGNIGPKETATRFNEQVKAKIKAVGGKLDDYYIMRSPDVGGDARFIIVATDSEGVMRTAVLTGNELRRK